MTQSKLSFYIKSKGPSIYSLTSTNSREICRDVFNFNSFRKSLYQTKIIKWFTQPKCNWSETQLWYNVSCSIQTSQKTHQSQTSYQLQPDGAELGPDQPQLVFFTSADKKGPPQEPGLNPSLVRLTYQTLKKIRSLSTWYLEYIRIYWNIRLSWFFKLLSLTYYHRYTVLTLFFDRSALKDSTTLGSWVM